MAKFRRGITQEDVRAEKREKKAKKIMGESRYAQQVRSKRRAKKKGPKASTTATIKRVGEYKAAKSKKATQAVIRQINRTK